MTNDDVIAAIRKAFPPVELSPEAKERIWLRIQRKLFQSPLNTSTWVCSYCDSGNIGSRCWYCKQARPT